MAEIIETTYGKVKLDNRSLNVYGRTGACDLHVAHDGIIDALRTFFRAEEDKRIGRWRWPEHPEWVVYPGERQLVTVFNEENPSDGACTLGKGGDTWPHFRKAANAYWAAHPEPKPWHLAKSGESWLVSVKGYSGPVACVVVGHPVAPEFFGAGLYRNLSVTSDQITDATVLYRP